MEFASSGQLISAASRIARLWGDPQTGIEHAAVAVLERLAPTAPLNAADWVVVATQIAATREGSAAARRFVGRTVRPSTISTEFRRSLEVLPAPIPAGPDEWLDWVERVLAASPRSDLQSIVRDVKALHDGLPRGATAGIWSHSVPFTLDLTELASEGRLSPVFGRDAELDIVIRILGRRFKNHPVLIGPPGVGKTAIVELLAARIVSGAVPEWLRGVRVLQLNVGEVLAGTRYRGDLEERLGRVVSDLSGLAGRAIVFVDEVHLLVGGGLSEGSPIDLGNLLKPALARGAIHLIGATTDLEYDEHIRRDPALERRLHPVQIGEPSLGATASILEGLRPILERHHRVTIPTGLIRRAVLMSSTLMVERYQPDKAIDLIDEACSNRSARSTDDDPLSLDDLLTVASGWQREGRADRHLAVRELPTTPRDLLATAILMTLADLSRLRTSDPDVIEVSGWIDVSDLERELRARLGDIASVAVVRSGRWPTPTSVVRQEAASIILVTGMAGEDHTQPVPVRLDHLPRPNRIPCVVVLLDGSNTTPAAEPRLFLDFSDLHDEAMDWSIRRLVRILAGSTGRIRIDPAAMLTFVRQVTSLDRADADRRVRELQRDISRAVIRELPLLDRERDLVVDVDDDGDAQRIVIRQVHRHPS